MNTFKIFQHPAFGLDAVKQGYAWPACFFGIFWMLSKRLWGMAAIWFGTYLVIGFWHAATYDPYHFEGVSTASLVFGLAHLALWIIPIFAGNGWRERNLLNRGYLKVAEIPAASSSDAIAQVMRMTPGRPLHAASLGS